MDWTQRDGTKIPVNSMADSHAKNTINMLIRNHGPQAILNSILYGVERAKARKTESERKPLDNYELNGEIAQDMIDQALESGFDPHWD